jgi:hypothetical protein
MFYLLFLLDRRIRIHTSDQRIRIQEAQKHGSDGSGSATLGSGINPPDSCNCTPLSNPARHHESLSV